MNYHLPINQKAQEELPVFVLSGKEMVCPQKIYRKDQYPSLPSDMVKIIGQDGRNIFIPLSKIKSI